MNTSHNKHWLRVGALSLKRSIAILAATAFLLGSFPVTAIASSWSPTLLVNTESFQSIDDGSSTTDIELRFGVTLNEKLYWDRTPTRFRFSDDLYVDGDLTASGTLSIEGAVTLGSTVKVNGVTYTFPTSDGSASGKVLKTNAAGQLSWSDDNNSGGGTSFADMSSWYVNDTGDTMTGALTIKRTTGGDAQNLLTVSGGTVVIQNVAPNNAVDILNVSGGSLKVSGNVNASGTLLSVGNISTRGDLTLNIDQTNANTLLTFGSDGTNETLTFINAADRFEFSDDLRATGEIYASGAIINEGNILSDGDITLNVDASTANGVFTFGSDGTNETLTWINLADRFEFSDDLRATGEIYASGAIINEGNILSDGDITLNVDASTANGVFTFGSDGTNETLTWINLADRFEFSDDLRATGEIYASGAIINEGNILSDGDITLNVDASTANGVFTFGSDGTNETLTWINLADRFEFSDDLRATGGIYASGGLIVEAGQTVTVEGVSYTFPKSDGAASGRLLATNGAGQLSWTDGSSSGDIVTLQPQYPGAIYFSSGATFVGQLSASGAYSSGATVLQNYYHWESTKTAMQNYWIATRVRIPDTFNKWDPTAPIQMHYRTGSGLTTNNYVTLRMTDTANANVNLTNATNLVNTSFTTANITGPESAGTYTAGSYMTLFVKLAASDPTDTADRGFAETSFIELNWETDLR